MQVKIADSWKNIIQPEFEKSYFIDLLNYIVSEYKNYQCYPQQEDIFAAFNFCSLEDLKVVIIGQDPYHQENQANGLCFSVKDNIKFPPSLNNIFKELVTDLNKEIPQSGNLEKWAEQGVPQCLKN